MSAPLARPQWNDLPAEVWCAVFECLPLAWERVVVGQVCAWWRAVTLNSAILWQNLDTPGLLSISSHMLDLLLNRSRGVSVRLSMPDLTLDRDSVLVLGTHLHRISSLRFKNDRPEEIAPLFVQPAPLLESLTLSRHEMLSDILPLPEELFAGVAPRLEAVSVNNIALPDRCPALAGVLQFTSSTIAGHQLEHLFRVMPRVDRLSVACFKQGSLIAEQPEDLTLSEVVLSGRFATLVHFPGLRLDQIRTLSAECFIVKHDVCPLLGEALCTASLDGFHAADSLNRYMRCAFTGSAGHTRVLADVRDTTFFGAVKSRHVKSLRALQCAEAVLAEILTAGWPLPAAICLSIAVQDAPVCLPQDTHLDAPNLTSIMLTAHSSGARVLTLNDITTMLRSFLGADILARCELEISRRILCDVDSIANSKGSFRSIHLLEEP